jgi:hypothetical protein
MTFRMRKKLLALALLLLCPALAPAGAFLSGIEDVPLAPSLTEAPGGGVSFDSPGGRIVEAEASGQVAAEQVAAFYSATLPQLGWTDSGKLVFRRENEVLRITIQSVPPKGTVVVRFNLTPNH